MQNSGHDSLPQQGEINFRKFQNSELVFWFHEGDWRTEKKPAREPTGGGKHLNGGLLVAEP